MFHGNFSSLNLPFVRFWAHAKHSRLVALRCRIEQVRNEPICMLRMMVHQLCECVKPVFGCHVYLQVKKAVIIIALITNHNNNHYLGFILIC